MSLEGVNMKIAIIQMDIDFNSPEENRKKVLSMVEKACEDKPDVILLPEMWNTSFNFESIEERADNEGQPTLGLLMQMAAAHDVNIIAGSIADKIDGSIFNRSYVINREGKKIFSYDKIHQVHHAKEDVYMKAGNIAEVFEIDGVKCGIIICYDLRFPELCRALALKGAKVIFAPVQWFETRAGHYEILSKARALENQVYFVTANRVGKEFKAVFCGKSKVIDPWAEVVGELDNEEGILYCEIDLDLIDRVRNKVTCYQDRRPDVY